MDASFHKALGPDGIPGRILKETAQQIAPSLTLLFDKSLRSAVVPDEWKLANVVPVFKRGIKEPIQNYRPISLLCIVSKVLERTNQTQLVSILSLPSPSAGYSLLFNILLSTSNFRCSSGIYPRTNSFPFIRQ